jgi:hypothetical protein
MRVTIDLAGVNDPPLGYMVVNGIGALVDVKKIHGLCTDPGVEFIEWGPSPEGIEYGIITRRVGDALSREIFAGFFKIQDYVDAHAKRIKELENVASAKVSKAEAEEGH